MEVAMLFIGVIAGGGSLSDGLQPMQCVVNKVPEGLDPLYPITIAANIRLHRSYESVVTCEPKNLTREPTSPSITDQIQSCLFEAFIPKDRHERYTHQSNRASWRSFPT